MQLTPFLEHLASICFKPACIMLVFARCRGVLGLERKWRALRLASPVAPLDADLLALVLGPAPP